MSRSSLRIRGARQNNLRNIDLDLPLEEFIVVTGVSGSGKSSLAFDTIYSEGQRRYVETFSPYARQFLDRMDKPQVDRIEGIPPAIAIDQTNPVRTSRSTVGTMTELNDYLKLLFARVAELYCPSCGSRVSPDDPESIYAALVAEFGGVADTASGDDESGDDESDGRGAATIVTFAIDVPDNFSSEEVEQYLARQGYTRIHAREGKRIEVVQDRFRLKATNRSRALEAIEAALKRGRGQLTAWLTTGTAQAMPRKFSARLHCATCDIAFTTPVPNSFSFNSPVGACDTCRGFGRTMGIDYRLVIPDESKSIAEGAIRPLQSKTYLKFQNELLRHARERGIDVDKPWQSLDEASREFVIEGEGRRRQGKWFGLVRFFAWLERKSYRMHIRVLLAKYRSYDVCADCGGARLKGESLAWRLGSRNEAERFVAPGERFRHPDFHMPDEAFRDLPGLSVHDVMQLSIDQAGRFFAALSLPAPLDEATGLVVPEIVTRLAYLRDVGLSYLTLDRQSRTLSGGEVQRINLTTALGTSLVNTLFVLDEPSVGLHARDVTRLVDILHKLRDAGNTLIVVEHDALVMHAADRIIDVGPGPGRDGGQIVFNGSPAALRSRGRSLTARYLKGQLSVSRRRKDQEKGQHYIEIAGASQHNLKGIDVRLPLGRLVCVTGVSGSGKSTLIEGTLYEGLARLKGHPRNPPGAHQAITGSEHIADVVLVDQSPIGKTTRSNPASFVGAFEAIRKRFADEPVARQRGYTPGTFSFNAGNGRCPSCSGNGFERIEMQFLSDVYLRCPDCDGTRYRHEILEVKYAPAGSAIEPHSIAGVLAMTVAEACEFFAGEPAVLRGLEPLVAVGLDYLSLGQSVPTLSGGEAQRLKLAAHLAQGGKRKDPLLFLFDEPTTGLHFADVDKLLQALSRLVDDGHSVVVIEHNIDLAASSDWIIDLGPEGGDGGGEVVVSGTVEDVMKHPTSHTAAALRSHLEGPAGASARPGKKRRSRAVARKRTIEIVQAREHNLRNVDISIPRDKLTAVTGVSGSGKSTVAFDILFAEGQRRYLESLNAYARQFVEPASRADVDAVHGIPPTVSIEQRTSRGGRKSTVATSTEIYHFLRLLFVKLGVQHCPDCDVPINAQSQEMIAAALQRKYRGSRVRLLSPLVIARKGYYTDLAQWAAARGYESLRVDGELTPTSDWPRLDRFREHDIELPVGEVLVKPESQRSLDALLGTALSLGRGAVRVEPLDTRGRGRRKEELYSSERACPSCERSFAALDPRLFSYNSRYGWCGVCFGTGLALEGFSEEATGEEESWLDGASVNGVCPACQGRRLCPQALAVYFEGESIDALTHLSVGSARKWFSKLRLGERAGAIARDILPELVHRLTFLEHVGLGYLTLDRAAPTLSGGEAQRIRLAAQLGSNLRGVCYILDEPTIGLHARDNKQLLETLSALASRGNTVVVVEHDEDTIRAAEHIIDLGPGAGRLGGELVASGTLRDIMKAKRSVTGRVLATPPAHPMLERRSFVAGRDPAIEIEGATRNNLRNVSVKLPLGRLVCVTGVSGSGKSTLIRDVLVDNLSARLGRKGRAKLPQLSGCKKLSGYDDIDRLLEVDQTPIGKTPRSCPATYVGIWDEIRKLFARSSEARMRGYTPSRFSFNVSGGRCDACEGQGVRRVSMSFLPDVAVLCERCGGGRFSTETLDVLFKDKSIADVLRMSVDDAAEFFEAHKKIHYTLSLLSEVGLGYLSLGQPSPTLSGGEAQRVKLVTELAKARPDDRGIRRARESRALYVLDEPTIGLHIADVEKLLRVINALVESGNSVIVIEHNLDVIAEADWIVDLGPEGGEGGGRIVAQGPPERLVRRKRHTPTSLALAEFFDRPQP